MFTSAVRLTHRRPASNRSFVRRRVVLVPFGEVVASADYSPTLGRFLTRDPIGIAGGDVNWYCYCGNDPVNFVDDDGLMSWSEWCKKWLMGLLGMLHPHPAPSGMSYAADPFGHNKIPGTENLIDPHIHQIPKRHGPNRIFNLDASPRNGGPKIPARDMPVFLRAVKDVLKYLPRCIMPVFIVPPGLLEDTPATGPLSA